MEFKHYYRINGIGRIAISSSFYQKVFPANLYELEASKSLLPLAADMAVPYGMTVYDALYLSLAKLYETTLMTADRTLVGAVAKIDLQDAITWLGSYN